MKESFSLPKGISVDGSNGLSCPATIFDDCLHPTDSRDTKHKLQALILMVTEGCNLRCDYCYITKHPKTMSMDTAQRAVDFLFNERGDGDRLELGFFGGEPMMVPELVDEICDYARIRAQSCSVKAGFSMTTNATLFGRYGKEVILKHKIGLTCSLDGVAEIHDAHRRSKNGRGSFSRIAKHLPFLVALPRVNVRMTVMPDAAKDLASGIEWLIEHGLKRFSITPVVEAVWSVKTLSDLVDAWEDLYLLQEKYQAQGVEIKNIEKTTHAFRSGASRMFGCGAARIMAVVNAAGVLYPCHRFIGYFNNDLKRSIGDVYNGFDDKKRSYYIRSNQIQHKKGCGIGLFDDGHGDSKEDCEQCLLNRVCGNGCIAINEYLNGTPDHPPSIFRVMSQITLSTHLRKLSILENTDPSIPNGIYNKNKIP